MYNVRSPPVWQTDITQGPESASIKPIKVALIDDGVKTSYASLDENIHCGKSGWGTARADRKKSTRAYLRNYNSSQTGHGTVMAYYICRVCPKVKLCVAKLDPQTRSRNNAGTGSSQQQMTFSIESVTEVSYSWYYQNLATLDRLANPKIANAGHQMGSE
jgi:hypothetical protein